MNKTGKGGPKKGEIRNPHGRPLKPEIQQLREALNKLAVEQNKTFIEHYVALAYKDRAVAIALANKILPELKNINVDVAKSLEDLLRGRKEPENYVNEGETADHT